MPDVFNLSYPQVGNKPIPDFLQKAFGSQGIGLSPTPVQQGIFGNPGGMSRRDRHIQKRLEDAGNTLFGVPADFMRMLPHGLRHELAKAVILPKGKTGTVSTIGDLQRLVGTGNAALAPLMTALSQFSPSDPLLVNKMNISSLLRQLPQTGPGLTRPVAVNFIERLADTVTSAVGGPQMENQWLYSGPTGGQTYRDPYGAVATRDPLGLFGSGDRVPDSYMITGKQGQTISNVDASKWLHEQAAAGNWDLINRTLFEWGITANNARQIAGWAPDYGVGLLV